MLRLYRAGLLCAVLVSTLVGEKICVVGTGYVGLVQGVGLAHISNDTNNITAVNCVDIDAGKIDRLSRLEIPIYEPGLDELARPLMQNGKLHFSTDVAGGMREADILFIAVGTPMSSDGSADLRAVDSVVDTIARVITSPKIIVVKSTVPVGTCSGIVKKLKDKNVDPALFEVVSNPEFLREGSAVQDFLHPDRIVIGGNLIASERVKKLYAPLIGQGANCLITTRESSELIKYVSNTLLAAKISLIDEIGRLCNIVGADVIEVACGVGMDKRIGSAFLQSGPGYGGSCFPKDVQALDVLMRNHKVGAKLVAAIEKSNKQHKHRLIHRVVELLGRNPEGKTVAVLGLAFKANTDDIRYSFAIDLIAQLIENNVRVRAYDPQAASNMKVLYPNIEYRNSWQSAVSGADVTVIVTEWDEFKNLDLGLLASTCRQKVIADLRNLFSPDALRQYGFTYFNVGRAC